MSFDPSQTSSAMSDDRLALYNFTTFDTTNNKDGIPIIVFLDENLGMELYFPSTGYSSSPHIERSETQVFRRRRSLGQWASPATAAVFGASAPRRSSAGREGCEIDAIDIWQLLSDSAVRGCLAASTPAIAA
jgi:hypothetical protein